MNENILKLLEERTLIISKLETMIYGAIEIRENNNKKYIYTHYRYNGKSYTRYIGEASNILINTILENNALAKDLKKRLNKINKELTDINFIHSNISDKVELNIILVKKYIIETIYNQSILEGIVTTYSDTETIINGGNAVNMNQDDINKIINLKRSWDFILNKDILGYPTNFIILCEINNIVMEGFTSLGGKLRTIPVKISGTNYIPSYPLESKTKEDINLIINSNKLIIDKTIDLVLYIMKTQPFIDGNKRTAIIFANHYLISHGLGLIVVPNDKVDIFRKLLIEYYEDKNDNVKLFLKNECYNNINDVTKFGH